MTSGENESSGGGLGGKAAEVGEGVEEEDITKEEGREGIREAKGSG